MILFSKVQVKEKSVAKTDNSATSDFTRNKPGRHIVAPRPNTASESPSSMLGLKLITFLELATTHNGS